MWNLNYRSIHLVAGSFILKCCKKLLKNVKSVLRPFISLKQFKHKRPRVLDVQLVSPHGFNSIHRYTLTNWLYTNITHDYFIHATGSSISLYNLFLSYASSRKVHRMTPNDLDMFNVKNTNMHAKCTPKTQIFARFALRWAVFELRKSAPKTPNGLDMFKVKNTPPPGTPPPPWGPNFVLLLYDEPFWVLPNFWNSARKDPKWPWYVQGQKYKHWSYIHPWGSNFHPFCSMIGSFWHVQSQRYTFGYHIYPWGPIFCLLHSMMSHIRGNWDFLIPHWLQCKN